MPSALSQSFDSMALVMAFCFAIIFICSAASSSKPCLAAFGSQVPATILASGSSISMGWPIHWTTPSFTMNAVGMPFWPAASM